MKIKLHFIVFLLSCMYSCPAQEVLHIQNKAALTVQTGAGIYVTGGITLANGSKLSNKGTILLLKNSKGGGSDWTDSTLTAYDYGSGKLVLNSSNGGNSHRLVSINSFGSIEVNAGSVLMASDITAGKWLLTNGIVQTGLFKAVVSNSAADGLQAGPSNTGFASSWFNGRLRRFVSPATVNNYPLPVGTASWCNLAVLDSLQANALNNISYLDAFIGPKTGTDMGLLVTESGIPDTAVSGNGVWHINPDVLPAAGTYNLLLYPAGFTDLVDNRFALLLRPDASSNAADWSAPAGSFIPLAGMPGRTLAAGFAKRSRLRGFGQFGIGLMGVPPGTITVKMFPNPNRGQFVISIIGTSKTFNAVLTDMMGRIVRTVTVTGANRTVITGLPTGMYVLLVPGLFNNGTSYTEKILILP